MEEERRAQCQIHEKELKEVRDEVFGNGKPGLKYDYIEFKSSMKSKITVVMWLLGLQFASTIGILVKGLIGD